MYIHIQFYVPAYTSNIPYTKRNNRSSCYVIKCTHVRSCKYRIELEVFNRTDKGSQSTLQLVIVVNNFEEGCYCYVHPFWTAKRRADVLFYRPPTGWSLGSRPGVLFQRLSLCTQKKRVLTLDLMWKASLSQSNPYGTDVACLHALDQGKQPAGSVSDAASRIWWAPRCVSAPKIWIPKLIWGKHIRKVVFLDI